MSEPTHQREDCCITVRQSGPLSGTVQIPGAKNSVLKLMAATLLADGDHELTNVPDIIDVGVMSELLAALGVSTVARGEGTITLRNEGRLHPVAPIELVERMRASINVLGPLIGRCGRVRLAMPGGDDFGSRPIDLHLKGLAAMGASIEVGDGYVEASTGSRRLHGAEIELDFPSVGATENLVMAAVHADGVTIIDNAAREPEIADLCHMLVAMGANIDRIGTGTLRVEGVEPGSLSATTHRTVADRVQAATYLAALGVCGGELTLRGARPDHMGSLLRRLVDMGLEIDPGCDELTARFSGRLRSVDIATLPYPGVATDYKPLIVTMLTVADGTSIVTENLYPGRFRYVEELQKLGANIATEGHHAVVRGVAHLVGAPVRAHDIRAGAALVVAGLAAQGATTIHGLEHIDRGYDDLVGRLAAVGAPIERT
jgi:UDP-N-acetylglucosamine 1-carboxyvinyltransferase